VAKGQLNNGNNNDTKHTLNDALFQVFFPFLQMRVCACVACPHDATACGLPVINKCPPLSLPLFLFLSASSLLFQMHRGEGGGGYQNTTNTLKNTRQSPQKHCRERKQTKRKRRSRRRESRDGTAEEEVREVHNNTNELRRMSGKNKTKGKTGQSAAVPSGRSLGVAATVLLSS
jgi:hypothetical protein